MLLVAFDTLASPVENPDLQIPLQWPSWLTLSHFD